MFVRQILQRTWLVRTTTTSASVSITILVFRLLLVILCILQLIVIVILLLRSVLFLLLLLIILLYLSLLLECLIWAIVFKIFRSLFSSLPWLRNVVLSKVKSFFSSGFFFDWNLLNTTSRSTLEFVHFFKVHSILLLDLLFTLCYLPFITTNISSKTTHFLALYARFEFIVIFHTIFFVLSPLSGVIYLTLSL